MILSPDDFAFVCFAYFVVPFPAFSSCSLRPCPDPRPSNVPSRVRHRLAPCHRSEGVPPRQPSWRRRLSALPSAVLPGRIGTHELGRSKRSLPLWQRPKVQTMLRLEGCCGPRRGEPAPAEGRQPNGAAAGKRANCKHPMTKFNKKELSSGERDKLVKVLKTRFENNLNRHKGLDWAKVQAKLEANPGKLWSLSEMERTGGEPDVVAQDKKTGEYVFYDCSPESPGGRTSLCYDREGWESRKEHRPKNTAIDLATEMGVELLTEEQYRELQKLGEFDTKSSSWVKTPPEMRKLGGALFCDRRFGRVFAYHNGAQSYYSGRGFRAWLKF